MIGIHSMHIVYSAYSVSFFVMAGLLWFGCRKALCRVYRDFSYEYLKGRD